VRVVEVQQTDDVARVLEGVAHWRPDALYVVPTGILAHNRDPILKFAAQHRLPAIYTVRGWVNAGGLMVYTPSPLEASRRAARYVDRSLKGARPAELPVEQPQTFDLAINLKTAKALGLIIPPAVLLRAELIQ
jgi:putative ABC transport system substrate-binding protein